MEPTNVKDDFIDKKYEIKTRRCNIYIIPSDKNKNICKFIQNNNLETKVNK